MDRETKKIITPSGKEVELKTYLTAGEEKELRLVFLKGTKMDIDMETQKPIFKDVSGAIADDAENKLIEIMLVSLDGSKENILSRILELRKEEFDFIVEEINKITKPDVGKKTK